MSGTVMICQHCGRPIPNSDAKFINGWAYHYACTQSPYTTRTGEFTKLYGLASVLAGEKK